MTWLVARSSTCSTTLIGLRMVHFQTLVIRIQTHHNDLRSQRQQALLASLLMFLQLK